MKLVTYLKKFSELFIDATSKLSEKQKCARVLRQPAV